jgi:hypothetical protein
MDFDINNPEEALKKYQELRAEQDRLSKLRAKARDYDDPDYTGGNTIDIDGQLDQIQRQLRDVQNTPGYKQATAKPPAPRTPGAEQVPVDVRTASTVANTERARATTTQAEASTQRLTRQEQEIAKNTALHGLAMTDAQVADHFRGVRNTELRGQELVQDTQAAGATQANQAGRLALDVAKFDYDQVQDKADLLYKLQVITNTRRDQISREATSAYEGTLRGIDTVARAADSVYKGQITQRGQDVQLANTRLRFTENILRMIMPVAAKIAAKAPRGSPVFRNFVKGMLALANTAGKEFGGLGKLAHVPIPANLLKVAGYQLPDQLPVAPTSGQVDWRTAVSMAVTGAPLVGWRGPIGMEALKLAQENPQEARRIAGASRQGGGLPPVDRVPGAPDVTPQEREKWMQANPDKHKQIVLEESGKPQFAALKAKPINQWTEQDYAVYNNMQAHVQGRVSRAAAGLNWEYPPEQAQQLRQRGQIDLRSIVSTLPDQERIAAHGRIADIARKEQLGQTLDDGEAQLLSALDPNYKAVVLEGFSPERSQLAQRLAKKEELNPEELKSLGEGENFVEQRVPRVPMPATMGQVGATDATGQGGTAPGQGATQGPKPGTGQPTKLSKGQANQIAAKYENLPQVAPAFQKMKAKQPLTPQEQDTLRIARGAIAQEIQGIESGRIAFDPVNIGGQPTAPQGGPTSPGVPNQQPEGPTASTPGGLIDAQTGQQPPPTQRTGTSADAVPPPGATPSVPAGTPPPGGTTTRIDPNTGKMREYTPGGIVNGQRIPSPLAPPSGRTPEEEAAIQARIGQLGTGATRPPVDIYNSPITPLVGPTTRVDPRTGRMREYTPGGIVNGQRIPSGQTPAPVPQPQLPATPGGPVATGVDIGRGAPTRQNITPLIVPTASGKPTDPALGPPRRADVPYPLQGPPGQAPIVPGETPQPQPSGQPGQTSMAPSTRIDPRTGKLREYTPAGIVNGQRVEAGPEIRVAATKAQDSTLGDGEFRDQFGNVRSQSTGDILRKPEEEVPQTPPTPLTGPQAQAQPNPQVAATQAEDPSLNYNQYRDPYGVRRVMEPGQMYTPDPAATAQMQQNMQWNSQNMPNFMEDGVMTQEEVAMEAAIREREQREREWEEFKRNEALSAQARMFGRDERYNATFGGMDILDASLGGPFVTGYGDQDPYAADSLFAMMGSGESSGGGDSWDAFAMPDYTGYADIIDAGAEQAWAPPPEEEEEDDEDEDDDDEWASGGGGGLQAMIM